MFITVVGQDYSSFSTIVIFYANEMIKSISVPIIDDTYAEPNEYFTLSIESNDPNNEVVFPITNAVIKITDNDGE